MATERISNLTPNKRTKQSLRSEECATSARTVSSPTRNTWNFDSIVHLIVYYYRSLVVY